jgi:23S rRNA G2445 N2-methylase RlmL
LNGVKLTEYGYRRIDGTCEGPLAPLMALRTVDDVYLHLSTWSGIARQRSTLAKLTSLAGELDLRYALRTLSATRRIPDRPHFSVTASFVGKRNYATEETKLIVAEAVASNASSWSYAKDDRRADLNLRLFIEHETAWVGVRLANDALNQRPYKRATIPGSLKAPVAASLVRLSTVRLSEASPNPLLLDPFCGAATILAEASMMGFEVTGGDVDTEAIHAACENLGRAGVTGRVRQWDATWLPILDSSVDRIVTNMPWGRQVTVNSGLEDLYRRSFYEMLRILAAAGRIVVLTSLPELLGPFSSLLVEQREISLFGQRPHVLVFEP